MAQGTVTLSEVREQETANSLKWVGYGVAIIALAALLAYILGVALRHSPPQLRIVHLGMGALATVGVVVIGAALVKLTQLRNLASVSFSCPYCDANNLLVAEPTSNFECETCHQTVRFDENGKMVPVRVISCPNCGTDNRVSVLSARLICSKCNSTIQVQAEQPAYGMGAGTPPSAPPPTRPAMLLNQHNVDVMIQSFDATREGKLAESLQSMLGVDAGEARRLLGTITDRAPLIVGVDMPHQEAERLEAQLAQLGARVYLRSR